MPIDCGNSLRGVRADWLRVQSALSSLRVHVAIGAYRRALARQQKFNRHHDDVGRLPTTDGAVAPGSAVSAGLTEPANLQKLERIVNYPKWLSPPVLYQYPN